MDRRKGGDFAHPDEIIRDPKSRAKRGTADYSELRAFARGLVAQAEESAWGEPTYQSGKLADLMLAMSMRYPNAPVDQVIAAVRKDVEEGRFPPLLRSGSTILWRPADMALYTSEQHRVSDDLEERADEDSTPKRLSSEGMRKRASHVAKVSAKRAEESAEWDRVRRYTSPPGLPGLPPKLWAGQPGRPRKGEDAPVVQFLREHYGPYFATQRDELRRYIFHRDRPLYDAIVNYERANELPSDVAMTTSRERVADRLKRAAEHGLDSLDRKSRQSVTVKLLRAPKPKAP